MDLIVRVNIDVNGLAEEDEPQALKRILEGGYIQHPSWVQDSLVRSVRNLNCFEAIREMLLNGTPTMEVARQVHLLNEWTDKSLGNVRVRLEHFRATLPKTQMLARMVPRQYVEVKKSVDKSLNTVHALEDLYERMMKRIDIGMKREMALEFLMNGMEKQFQVVLDIVSKIHEYKKELAGDTVEITNDMQRIADQTRIDWSRVYSSPNVNEVMSNPESRARLVRFVEGVSKIAGKLSPEEQAKVMRAARKRSENAD